MDHPILYPRDLTIPDRLRKEHGDIDEFAAGIAEVGHLIQPIVLNRITNTEGQVTGYKLIAGGRRTKALELLEWPLRYGFEYVFKEDLDDDVALELELAENMDRMNMSWQEECLSIQRIHSLKVKKNAEDGKDWGHAETGKMVGMQKTNVGNCIQIAKVLSDTTQIDRLKWVSGAVNFRDAISRLMKWKEDEGMKWQAQQLISKPSPIVGSDKSELTDEYLGIDSEEDDHFPEDNLTGDTVESVLREAIEKSATQTIPITKMLINDKWENVLSKWADGSFDGHIITDPPYAIEMDNIQQQGAGMNVDSVRGNHDVEDNLAMIAKFIPEAYRVMSDKRFMVLFCDMEHFNTILDLGLKAGFKATRWPLVWVKTHHCQNNCAQYNFTKATEDAIVFRKGDAILARPPQTNYYIGDNVAVKAKHGGHPFVKPSELWTWIASHVALKGQTILDPFMGEASCGEAVLPMGWNYIGIEEYETHYSKAVVYICAYFSRIYHDKVRFV